ncbi:MAG: hypothetical protein ACOYWZ_00755 [Bacillota bacterium]
MFTGKNAGVIIFNSINVNSIDSVSGIFVGENSQSNWSSTGKTNSGFGRVMGEMNAIRILLNVLSDPDIVDSPYISKGSKTEVIETSLPYSKNILE